MSFFESDLDKKLPHVGSKGSNPLNPYNQPQSSKKPMKSEKAFEWKVDQVAIESIRSKKLFPPA